MRMRSTTSMPETTLPNTANPLVKSLLSELKSSRGLSTTLMKNCAVAESAVLGARAAATVPRRLERPLFDSSTIGARSEEHTSELQSLMRSSYAVFCFKKKPKINLTRQIHKPHHQRSR